MTKKDRQIIAALMDSGGSIRDAATFLKMDEADLARYVQNHDFRRSYAIALARRTHPIIWTAEEIEGAVAEMEEVNMAEAAPGDAPE